MAIQAAKNSRRDQWDQFSGNREKFNAKRNALGAGMQKLTGEDEVAALRASLGYNSLRAAANREVWANLSPDEYEPHSENG